MSPILRDADLRSERAQQAVQRMLGHASAALAPTVYADLFSFSDGRVGIGFGPDALRIGERPARLRTLA